MAEQITNTHRVYKQGASAAAKQKTVGDNPYHEKDKDHWRWLAGFSATAITLLR